MTNAQIGDSTNEEFLQSLGIRNYDVCIVAIGNDFQSSLNHLFVKRNGSENGGFQGSKGCTGKVLLRNGADDIVYPEKQVANWTAIRYSADHILDYIELSSNYTIFEVTIPKNWIGKTVGEIDIRNKYSITIMAVKKEGKIGSYRFFFNRV